MEEETYALPTVASVAPNREYYRYELQQQIRKMYDEQGIIPIIDWLNEVTRRIRQLQVEMQVDNLDVLQEEVIGFFMEKYPPYRKSKYGTVSMRKLANRQAS